MTRKRRLLPLAVLAVLFLGAVLLRGPGVTEDTLALHRFLSESGVDVHDSNNAPAPPGTFVLVRDVREPDQVASLLRWVESGGRLVVTDPRSGVLDQLGVGIGEPIGLVGVTSVAPGCPAPETVGVGEIAVDADDLTLRPSGPNVLSCFARPEGSYMLILNRGEGRITLLGGRSALTNDLLDEGDNALLALQLLRGPVVFGSAAPPGTRSQGLWDLLPEPAQLVLVEIAIAALVFALARARRLGRPVIEEPIAPVPAGELVRATAGLYRRARASGFCGGLLRRSAGERFSRIAGASPEASPERLTELVSASTGVPRERVEHALRGPEPGNDEELLALAVELAAITREIEGAGR